MVSLKKNAEDVKQKIEARGPTAKDVTLDVSFFNTQRRLNLLDQITRPFEQQNFEKGY